MAILIILKCRMSEQWLSEKNVNKFRKRFPELAIRKVTTWGHSKALWCFTGMYVVHSYGYELNEDWDGDGKYIGTVEVPGSWKKEYGENYVFNPEDI